MKSLIILGNALLHLKGTQEDMERIHLLSSLMPPTCKETKIKAGTITQKKLV